MSLAQEMVEQEKIAKDELMKHEERNNLYAYLGQKNFKPVVSKKIKLVENDMIALYTRGIWENVDEAELDDVFAEADNEVKTTVDNIEDLLLSRQPENLDNYTLAVIFINKVYQNPEKRKRIKKIVTITVAVVIAVIIIGVVLWFLHYKKVQTHRGYELSFYKYGGIYQYRKLCQGKRGMWAGAGIGRKAEGQQYEKAPAGIFLCDRDCDTGR